MAIRQFLPRDFACQIIRRKPHPRRCVLDVSVMSGHTASRTLRIIECEADGNAATGRHCQHPPVIILFCHRIPSTSFAMRLFTSSGWSVLELCPASLIHSKGMPVFLCHALLYRTQEPALSCSPQINKAGHLIS